jgi:hypothetical protein
LLVLAMLGLWLFVPWHWLTAWASRRSPAPLPELWQKTAPRLEWADRTAAAACERKVQGFALFFRERGSHERTTAFAEAVLSWGGKWALLKDMVGAGDHRAFLADCFSRHVFAPQDLKAALEATVSGFLAELDQMENDLLVQLRADLADEALGRRRAASFLQSDEAFRLAYRRVAEAVRPQLERELHITIGREVGALVAMEVATQLVLRLGAGLAAELGVEAGILGTGAAAGVATLGVGLVVGLVVDALLSDLMRLAGHDPERKISRQVQASLENVSRLLIEGNDAALRVHQKLCVMAEKDSFQSVRAAARKAADRIEQGGQLGLHWQLRQLWQVRAAYRRAALQQLLVEGGGR